MFNAQREEYREERTDHFTEIDADGRAYRIRSIGGKDYKYYKDDGRYCHDVWDIDAINAFANERTGYPTQKPLALLERVIRASSNEGDMVLDPFCGCATTPVAAERLGRQWVGMDLWAGAHRIVVSRLRQEKQIWRPEQVKLITVPPRTDDAEPAAPYLQQIERGKERRPLFSKERMMEILIGQWGAVCWGCGFEPPNRDDRHFDLAHIDPKSEGEHNDLDNRAVLCRPCNGRKGNRMTLTALRQANRRDGYWYGSPPLTSAL